MPTQFMTWEVITQPFSRWFKVFWLAQQHKLNVHITDFVLIIYYMNQTADVHIRNILHFTSAQTSFLAYFPHEQHVCFSHVFDFKCYLIRLLNCWCINLSSIKFGLENHINGMLDLTKEENNVTFVQLRHL